MTSLRILQTSQLFGKWRGTGLLASSNIHTVLFHVGPYVMQFSSFTCLHHMQTY